MDSKIIKFIALFALLLSFNIYALDTSNGNGDWENNTTWIKGVEPTTEDTLIIVSGDTVDITSNYTYPSDVVVIVRGALRFSGKLNLNANSKLYVDGGALISEGGGNSDKLKIGGDTYWEGKDGDLTVDTVFPDGPPLPVTWVEFYGETELNTVNLYWTTATEINNDGFEIQTSSDVHEWNTIGFVNGRGNSTVPLSYRFSFESNCDDIVYIRLKQIDYDGQFEYSKVIALGVVQPTDENVLYYVTMLGDRTETKPSKGLYIAVYKNGQNKRIFIK